MMATGMLMLVRFNKGLAYWWLDLLSHYTVHINKSGIKSREMTLTSADQKSNLFYFHNFVLSIKNSL
jgi:hypothetical protein